MIRIFAFGLFIGALSPVYSATAIESLTGESGITGDGSTDHLTAGYEITIGSSSIWVTALGYYDPGSDGLEDPSALVGIYVADGFGGAEVVSVTAGAATTNFSNNYRFIELNTPIELLAGMTYRVLANTGSVGGASHNEVPYLGTPVAGSELSIGNIYLSDVGSPSSGLVWSNSSGPAIYLGNFEYTTSIPEPSVAVLSLLSLGGLLRRRR